MRFTLYTYLEKHPVQMKAVQLWLKLNLPVPSGIKRQLANEIHAEMIVRLMDILVREGELTIERALQVHFEIGKEIAEQVKNFLSVNPNDAASLSGIIDFLHGLLCISGKESIEHSPDRAVSHWRKCSLSGQLSERKEGGGPYYCHLFQEMYKGVLFGINPNARANDLETTRSQGFAYCELQTWIEQDA